MQQPTDRQQKAIANDFLDSLQYIANHAPQEAVNAAKAEAWANLTRAEQRDANRQAMYDFFALLQTVCLRKHDFTDLIDWEDYAADHGDQPRTHGTFQLMTPLYDVIVDLDGYVEMDNHEICARTLTIQRLTKQWKIKTTTQVIPNTIYTGQIYAKRGECMFYQPAFLQLLFVSILADYNNPDNEPSN